MYINDKLNNFKREIYGKKVAIIGMGVSNIPLISYLNNIGTQITVFDKRNKEDLPEDKYNDFYSNGIGFSLGENYLDGLNGFDYIFRSPSMRPDLDKVREEVERGAILTSEIEMLIELCPSTIVGVTGSDGKTTTTTLIYNILKEEGYNCYLGGNIGVPLFSQIDKMLPEDYIVLELSSFQLMTLKKSPQIAVVTNISPNHLDIHKSYEEYINAKKNIFLYQHEDDLLVLNKDNEITSEFKYDAKGRIRYFSRHKESLKKGIFFDDEAIKILENGDEREVIKLSEIKLLGKHNYENCMTAIAATKDLVSLDSIKKVLSTFNGVEHRNEVVRVVNDVTWRNDSIGSSPTRTIAGLLSFNDKVILIAGGYDKHLDYTEFGKYVSEHVKSLILLGQTAEKILVATKAAMSEKGMDEASLPIYEVKTLEEAVAKANEIAIPGDIVFFSPASASFDMFKNFEERGKKYKELVTKL
jgi:UDP-N-acetylmuramoylalanine--D-glutamate ligase